LAPFLARRIIRKKINTVLGGKVLTRGLTLMGLAYGVRGRDN
jgi:hypothetical protein